MVERGYNRSQNKGVVVVVVSARRKKRREVEKAANNIIVRQSHAKTPSLFAPVSPRR